MNEDIIISNDQKLKNNIKQNSFIQAKIICMNLVCINEY